MKPIRLRRPSAPTLSTALDRYLAEVSSLKKGAAGEASIARSWRATNIAGRPIDRIRNTDLIAIRDEWAKTKAAATVVRRLALLSHLYTVIRKDWGWTELANPVQLVRRPTVSDARERRVLEHIRLRGVPDSECPRSELEWIIRSTRSAELPIIATLAAESAMRRSEICGITRERVDLRHGIVRLVDTKNGTSRDVPLTPLGREVLRQYLAGKPPRGRIFTITPSAVTRAFIRARRLARKNYEALCRRYGRRPNPAFFVDLRFHDLRHEATSTLAPIFQMHELAKISGHKDTRMLLRYYHPDGRELVAKIARSALGRRQAARIRNDRPAAPACLRYAEGTLSAAAESTATSAAGTASVSHDGKGPPPSYLAVAPSTSTPLPIWYSAPVLATYSVASRLSSTTLQALSMRFATRPPDTAGGSSSHARYGTLKQPG